MSQREDLERDIQESWNLIREYEAIRRTSDRPEEKVRARRIIREQRALIAEYQAELAELGEEKPTEPEPPPVTPPDVSVSVMTDVLPTAYAYQLDEKTFPLITVTLDNTAPGGVDATMRVVATIEGYSDDAIVRREIPAGEQIEVSLLPLLQPARIAVLNEVRPSTLHVKVEQIAPSTGLLYDQTDRIRLHARDTALLAVEAPDGSVVDLTDYLAAWVTPRHPEIEKLLRRAIEHHPNRQLVGYQGATTVAQGTAVVRRQAQAIFEALKHDASLTYVNSTLNMGRQEKQVTQRVRLPTTSLGVGGSANCIDGTVLFASLLELASIDPLLVIVPGHVFVGWRIWQGTDRYEFLETTMIGASDFVAAQQEGQAQYDRAQTKGFFDRKLFDRRGFARLVDVAACRAKGIMPLE